MICGVARGVAGADDGDESSEDDAVEAEGEECRRVESVL